MSEIETTVQASAPVEAATKKVAVKKVNPAAKKAAIKKVSTNPSKNGSTRTKPEALRGPQVAILKILKKKTNGINRKDLGELLKKDGKAANLSEMIGTDEGTGNPYTTTLLERKMVRLEVQESGPTLVLITATGLKGLEKTEKAE